jgi:DNA modification methylase
MERHAIYTKALNVDTLLDEGQEWNFHDVSTKEHLHSLHPYPAKFIPQIPRKAIQEWSLPGELVYDPFSGCGTTLLEASLLNRPSIGTDNNAVAVLASKAKLARYLQKDLNELKKFLDNFEQMILTSSAREDLIPDNPNFKYWFDEKVSSQLAILKGLILNTEEPITTMLMSIFSSIIVKVSYQDSDTRYSRIERTVDSSEVNKAFRSKLKEVIDKLPEIMINNRAPATVYQADSRKINFIHDETVSLIVTSPPYLNAYDYHKYHRQRLHWINGDVGMARDLEIGKHDDFTRPNATPDRYFVDMNSCFVEWQRVLKKGGKCIIIIGDAIVTKQPVYVADTFIELMKKLNLKLTKHWIRELQSTKRAFNVKNSRMSHEHVLLFEKT